MPSRSFARTDESGSSQRTAWAVRTAGITAALIGGFWLAAWLGGWAGHWSSSGVLTVKTNMALCQLLGGLALLLLGPPVPTLLRRWAGGALAFAVLLVGSLTFGEHLSRYDLGLDQLLAIEAPGAVATASPNRMGPPGSASLALLGAGLLALAWGWRSFVPYAGLAVCLINLVPAVGFVYGIVQLYGQPRLTHIAWPSVVALLALGTGLMLAHAERGPMALLLRPDAGGAFLRRALPAAILVPLALGFVRTTGQLHGFYDTATGTGLLVLALILFFTFFLWRSAAHLSRNAAAQAEAQEALRESEARLRFVVDHSPDKIFLQDRDLRYVWVSRAAHPLTPEEYLGKTDFDLFSPEDARMLAGIKRRIIEAGKAETAEIPLAIKGEPRILEAAYAPWRDAPGAVVGLAGYVRDITGRKRAEEALAREQRVREAVFNNTDVMLALLDTEFRFVAVNPAYAEGCRMRPEDLLGRNHFALFPNTENETIFRRVRDTGEPVFFKDKPFEFPDQPERGITYWDWSLAPMKDARDAVAGLVFSLRETTPYKRAEEALHESEEWLQAALDAGDLGTWRHDLVGGRMHFDARARVHFGFESESVSFSEALDRVHPEDRERLRLEIAAVLDPTTGGRLATEYRVVHRDGSVRWIAVQSRIVFEGAGEERRPLWGGGTSQDITERKHAEQALRESEQRYHALFSEIDEGYCIIEVIFDPEGKPVDYRFLETNPAFAKHTGLVDVLGKTMKEMAPGHEEHWFQTYGEVARTGTPARFENRAAQLGRWYDVYAFRFGNPEDRQVAVLFNDITLRKRTEEELRALNEELEVRVRERTAELERSEEALRQAERLATIGLVMTGLSHESRNALQRSLVGIEMLRRRLKDQPALEHLVREVRKANDDLRQVYEGVQDYARPIVLKPQMADVALAWREAWRTLAGRDGRKALLREEADEVDRVCEVDLPQLEQVFGNLLDNALAACPDPVEVRVRCLPLFTDAGPLLRVLVRDNGPGLTPEQRLRIFEPFYTTKTKGTGLGLAIAKRIVEAHGGHIALNAQTQGGLEVVIDLPRRATGEPAAADSTGRRRGVPADVHGGHAD